MKTYRLRLNKKIVGFAEETNDGILIKNKKLIWFVNGKPKYNSIDISTGIKDKLHREIFENDIVIFKHNPKEKECKAAVVYKKVEDDFVLFDIEKQQELPLFINETFLFENDKLEVVSHVFNAKKVI